MLNAFLIDDDPDDQDFFCLVLKRAIPDASCSFAEDCPRAMEKLRDSDYTPNLIFIDINMPRLNGFECLRELRRIPRLQQVPAFMYSTAEDHRILEQCKQLGANGFLKKKFSIAEAKKDFEHIIAKLGIA